MDEWLYTGCRGVAISVMPGSIPGGVGVEINFFILSGWSLGACCTVVVSDFHNIVFMALVTYFGI